MPTGNRMVNFLNMEEKNRRKNVTLVEKIYVDINLGDGY
jgi:hypothetical protein